MAESRHVVRVSVFARLLPEPLHGIASWRPSLVRLSLAGQRLADWELDLPRGSPIHAPTIVALTLDPSGDLRVAGRFRVDMHFGRDGRTTPVLFRRVWRIGTDGQVLGYLDPQSAPIRPLSWTERGLKDIAIASDFTVLLATKSQPHISGARRIRHEVVRLGQDGQWLNAWGRHYVGPTIGWIWLPVVGQADLGGLTARED